MFKKILLTCIILLAFGGCANREDSKTSSTDNKVTENVPKPVAEKSPQEQKIADIQKKLEIVDKKIIDSPGSVVTRLTYEKESLSLKVQLAEAYSQQWKANAIAYMSQVKDKEVELKNAKIEAWQVKLWVMAGICGLIAIIAGGVAIGFPLLRPVAVKASAIVGGVAVIMLIVAQCLPTVAWMLGIVPYILGVAGVVVLIYCIFALREWYRDHVGLEQTVEGIETIKGKMSGFGDHMLKYVDGGMVDHIKNIRGKLNSKNKK